MKLYHGTTERRARRICAEGFKPKAPSRRVWFSEDRSYAEGRARCQAKRAHDYPVVVMCEVALDRLRAFYRGRRLCYGSRVLAINGPVPVSVLAPLDGHGRPLLSPHGLAAWVNRLTGNATVSAADPAVMGLAAWAQRRLQERPKSIIRPQDLLDKARQWLPAAFVDVAIEPTKLSSWGRVRTVRVELLVSGLAPQNEAAAIDGLAAARPRGRIRALKLLATMHDPDLFDWCLLMLEDASLDVRLTALRLMLECGDTDPFPVLSFTRSEVLRERALATAVMAWHLRYDDPSWFKRALSDPSGCVRFEAGKLLARLDPIEHREILAFAFYDPNPEIVRRAERVAVGLRRAHW